MNHTPHLKSRASKKRFLPSFASKLVPFLMVGFFAVLAIASVGIEDRKDIVGVWRVLKWTSSALDRPHETNWTELKFDQTGHVSVSVKPEGTNEVHTVGGTYTVYDTAKSGFAPRVEVHMKLQFDKASSEVVLRKVRIGEFSCFPSGKRVLWFEDQNGLDCVYEPIGKDTGESNKVQSCQNANKVETGASRILQPMRRPRISRKKCDDLLRACADMYAQHCAIMRIMNEGDASCAPALIPFTRPDKDALLRQDAIRALGAIGSQAAVTRLVEILGAPVESQRYEEDEDDAILRREAVLALGTIGDTSALPVLESVASSKTEYESVRALAGCAVRRLFALDGKGVRNREMPNPE